MQNYTNDGLSTDDSENKHPRNFRQTYEARRRRERPELILPSNTTEYTECAEQVFTALAKTGEFFVRDRELVRIIEVGDTHTLVEVDDKSLVTILEEHFVLKVERALGNGEFALKPSRCKREQAIILLATDVYKWLPTINIIASAPVFTDEDGRLEVLPKGYHDMAGGVYVLKNRNIREMDLEKAKNELRGLLDDFNFVSVSDKSRALASFISPALRLGGLLEVDFPLDIAEADQSQSGKTYRQKIVSALYGEKPFVITLKEKGGGVGSTNESVSEALLSGRPFLMLENVRGKVASELLESSLRGHGWVNARRAYQREVQVATDRICWMLTSNEAQTNRDLSNRSIITRIRKQPRGRQFKTYDEGDLLAHVKENVDDYLSAIYTVLCAWHRKGKQRTRDTRHDFREWCQTLDWIVQNIFECAPLLDGHREEQDRISTPELGWLRKVAFAIKQDDKLEDSFKVGELINLCEQHGIDIYGNRSHMNEDQVRLHLGKVLRRVFREEASVRVDCFEVIRETRNEYNENQRKCIDVHYYQFRDVSK